MERVVELTKKTFSKEFLKVSLNLNEVSEALWLIFKSGGSAPIDMISVRFPNFPKDLLTLEETGILEVSNDRMVLFSEKFEEKLIIRGIAKISRQNVKSILLNYYGDKLSKRFGTEGLENSLAIVLSSVILSTKPNKPALLNEVVHTCNSYFGDTGKVLKNVVGDSQLILNHYLNRSLELVVPVSDIGVKLTPKAERIIRRNQFLWLIYSGKSKKRK